MKTEQIILVSYQGWFRIADGQSQAIKPWAEIRGPAIVVVDFYESQVGLQACKGKADYAAAQIEKQVRSEGSIEGPLHVFVHQQIRHEGSNLALYTAVSLERWQGLQAWASRQADHCLVVPLAALLAGAVSEDQLLILRAGTQLHGFSAYNDKMFYAGAAALGYETSDLVAPVTGLFNQLRAAGWKGSSKDVRWGSVLTEDLDAERAMLAHLSTEGLMDAKLLQHDPLRSGTGTNGATTLPKLLETTRSSNLHAPGLSRLAWLSETYVMPLAAMVTVVAIGLGAFAYVSQGLMGAELQAANDLESEMQGLRQRVTAVNQAEATAKMPPATVAFITQLGFAAVHDPIQMLATVRRAAGSTVRVQRLQLTKTNSSAQPHFRVDGVVMDGSNDGLRGFLSELRTQGWQAESATPSDSAPGAFAYKLTPLSMGKGI
jgi:hypothetical protein